MQTTLRAISFFILLLSSETALSASETMKVNIEYSRFMDSMCALFKGYEISDTWKEELKQKKSQLESEWKEYGWKLLDTTEAITGKKFERTSVTARLTLCNTPSRSVPVIVNMRYSLSSFTDKPVPIHVKTGTLYHELLHQYVDNNIPKNSTLLNQYRGEHERVLDHLHLLALIKVVYTKLRMTNQLTDIIKVDSMLPNGYYKRAWEIVNSRPSYYMEFVGELQA